MADENNEAETARIVAEQRATDPRLEQAQPEPTEAPQAAEPAETGEPTGEAVEAAPEAAEPVGEPAQAEPPPKPKKDPLQVLQGRVGHLTKVASEKDRQLADTRAQLEAAQRLIAASGGGTQGEGGEGAAPASAPQANGAGNFATREDFEAAVAREATARAFNEQANQVFASGTEKYGDFQDKVALLNAAGLIDQNDMRLVEGAMATDAAVDVIHHLGTDLEEAQRVLALPPIRMAAEMQKIAQRLSAPKPGASISGAPAPIKPVNGAANPAIDLTTAAGDGNDTSAYAAARAKQGAQWAQPPRRRVY